MHSMQERDSGGAAPTPNIVWHATAVNADARLKCTGQRGATVWLTGISGAGKSTIAVQLERQLIEHGHMAFLLDGDNLRHGLNAGIGFDAAGRTEAVRRAGEAALLLAQSGVVAIVSMISPYRAGRDGVRARHSSAEISFIEVFVDVPLAEAERRDPKGLYAKARSGELKGFTGVDDPYEAPNAPELRLPTHEQSPEQCVRALMDAVEIAIRID